MFVLVVSVTLVADVCLGTVLSACGVHIGPRKHEWYYRESHPVLHHGFKANASYDEALWGTHVYRVRTNSLAFKDQRVRPVPLTSEAHRIVFLGDSFTEGIGVEYDKTFVGRVDQALAARGIEVLNAAVYSYSPILYLRKAEYMLETLGLEFDEIVAFLDLSDILNEAQWYTLDAERNVLDRRDARRRDGFRRFVADNTILLNLIATVARRIRRRLKPFDTSFGRSLGLTVWDADATAWEEWGRRGFVSAERHMNALAGLCKERAVRLTIGVYPWPDQIMAGDLAHPWVTRWRDWAARHGVDFIDCFPAFLDGRPPETVIRENFFAGDNHWNEAGHAVVAKVVLEYFDRRDRTR